MRKAWSRLDRHTGPAPAPAPLGYRGCHLHCPGESWHAYGGVVTRVKGRREEARSDPRRTVETLLLATAPPGTLPRGLKPK